MRVVFGRLALSTRLAIWAAGGFAVGACCELLLQILSKLPGWGSEADYGIFVGLGFILLITVGSFPLNLVLFFVAKDHVAYYLWLPPLNMALWAVGLGWLEARRQGHRQG